MKPILHIIFLLLLTSSAKSQSLIGERPEKNVPVVVSAVFNDQFPSNDPVWFSRYQGRFSQQLVYEARFIFSNKYSSAFYTKEGSFIAFASSIDYAEIPVEIRKYMMQNFPGFSILNSILVTKSDGDKTYEIGIMVDDEYIIKVFSEKGDFIKSTRA
jgi:hypothetical protein